MTVPSLLLNEMFLSGASFTFESSSSFWRERARGAAPASILTSSEGVRGLVASKTILPDGPTAKSSTTPSPPKSRSSSRSIVPPDDATLAR